MEIVVAPNMDVVRRGVIIGPVTKLGSGLGGISARKNLSRNSTLPTTSGIVKTP